MTQPAHRGPHERSLIRHRTAPEAAPMVVGRAGERPSRRRSVIGIAMLAVGILAVAVGLFGLGSRILPTARTVRDTTLDPIATYFMGTEGSTGELVLAVALIVLIPVGLVAAWLGYRRLVTGDGPSLAAMHVANSPAAVMNRGGGGSL